MVHEYTALEEIFETYVRTKRGGKASSRLCHIDILKKKRRKEKKLYYIFDLTYPPKDCLCGSSEVEGETTPSTRADRSSDPADPCGKTKVLLSRGISGGGVI